MSWALLLLITLASLALQGYFAMMEMAMVSYNKVRLQYNISSGDRKAIWLGKLYHNPTYLFGTTLIGVNLFLQMGSEASRLFYQSIGMNPNYACISQIFLAILFAELAPMIAARGSPEHVVALGIRAIYLFSKLFAPFIWIVEKICKWMGRFLGDNEANLHVTREELQKAIEGKKRQNVDQEHLDSLVAAIFSAKGKKVGEIMQPIDLVPSLSCQATAEEAIAFLRQSLHPYPFLPVVQEKSVSKNILGILYARDLLKLKSENRIGTIVQSPWFITENALFFSVLKQFRSNNRSIAIVLDQAGNSCGILTLEALLDELFEEEGESLHQPGSVVVDRAFSANTPLSIVNQTLGIALQFDKILEGEGTLEDFMEEHLGHPPGKLEILYTQNFSFKMENSRFFAEKVIKIRSLD